MRAPLEPIRLHGTNGYAQAPPPPQTRVLIGSLLIGIVFITLIACANVANLLLARGHARRGEIALRLALGAPRGRVLRLLLTESFMLTLVAAAVGLAVAVCLPQVLAGFVPLRRALRITPSDALRFD